VQDIIDLTTINDKQLCDSAKQETCVLKLCLCLSAWSIFSDWRGSGIFF